MAAPQPVLMQFWDGSAFWTNQLTLSASPAKVTRGTDGESGLRPSKIEIDLNNDDNRYDVSDPMSPLYGVAKRNIRVRLRVNNITRTQAEASAYQPDKTIDHVAGTNRGRAWCALTAEGVLRRILQWETPLHSPMYRAVTGITNLVGYWPLEDGRDAGQLTNAARNGQPGSATGITYQGGDGPGGSDQLVTIGAGTVMSGNYAAGSTTAGWQVSFATKLTAIPAAIGFLTLFSWYTSNGYQWTFDVDDNEYRVTVRDSVTGTILKSSQFTFGTGAEPNQWITFRVKVSASGGTVTFEPAWYPEGVGVLYGVTDTFAGSVGRLTRWRVTGNAHNTGATMGHIYAVTTVADNLQSYGLTRAFDGFPGELAGDRFTRLCGEEGVSQYVTGSTADTMPMGVQRPATFKQHLEQIVATEDALLFDEALDLAIRLVTRRARYTQAPAAAFTYPTHIKAFTKVIDDLGVKNYITVSNAAGGEYIAERSTGPLSTAASPAGIGLAKDTVEVNVLPETLLADVGSWYLNRGTIDRARYPKIVIDLLANPGLETTVNGIEIGSLITITGLEKELVPLIVVGTVETVGHITRDVELTCLPADVYDIGVYDDPGDRYDALTSALAAPLTTTGTSASITCTDAGDIWSTTAVPYQWLIAGERVTVTAITAAAGTGPYTQTATITRSVNGVVKTQATGAEVHIADPARYGL